MTFSLNYDRADGLDMSYHTYLWHSEYDENGDYADGFEGGCTDFDGVEEVFGVESREQLPHAKYVDGKVYIPLEIACYLTQWTILATDDKVEISTKDGRVGLRTATTPSSADKPASWAVDKVQAADKLGLVTDEMNGAYQSATTRAEFCRLAVRFIEVYTGKPIADVLTERGLTAKTFADTNDAAIGAAAALGITSGTDTVNNLFSPDTGLTREQAATMLNNVLIAIGKDTTPPPGVLWTDEKEISSWAKTAADVMYAAKVIGGTSTTELVFSPKSPYTHEQGIVTVQNLWEYIATQPVASGKLIYDRNGDTRNILSMDGSISGDSTGVFSDGRYFEYNLKSNLPTYLAIGSNFDDAEKITFSDAKAVTGSGKLYVSELSYPTEMKQYKDKVFEKTAYLVEKRANGEYAVIATMGFDFNDPIGLDSMAFTDSEWQKYSPQLDEASLLSLLAKL
jgi:hypothetical protein